MTKHIDIACFFFHHGLILLILFITKHPKLHFIFIMFYYWLFSDLFIFNIIQFDSLWLNPLELSDLTSLDLIWLDLISFESIWLIRFGLLWFHSITSGWLPRLHAIPYVLNCFRLLRFFYLPCWLCELRFCCRPRKVRPTELQIIVFLALR